MQPLKSFLPIVLLVAVAGCVQPYDLEIQQGNVVTEEMIRQLERGMSQREVRFVLGSPLVADPFQPQRWDYYYWREAHDDDGPEQRRITLFFDDDGRLERMTGDVIAIRPKPENGGDQAGAGAPDRGEENAAEATPGGEKVAQVAEGDASTIAEAHDRVEDPAGESPGFLRRWWRGIWE